MVFLVTASGFQFESTTDVSGKTILRQKDKN
jgi:hypothetical protein